MIKVVRLPLLLLPTAMLLAVLSVVILPRLADTALDNPDLTATCGLDVILVLDESGSIVGTGSGASDISASVRSGADALVNALADTGSSLAVLEFNSNARNPIPFTEVTSGGGGTVATTFAPYLAVDSNTTPDGTRYDPEDYGSSEYFTNWEAAFIAADTLGTGPTGDPPLIIFFTDGNPTAYYNPLGTVGTASPANLVQGTGFPTPDNALDEGEAAADVVKFNGSHVFVVGIPNPSVVEANVQAISGPDRFPDLEPDFGQGDYTLTSAANLSDDLRDIAFELCAPSITLTKWVEGGSGYVKAGEGEWEFSATVTITETGQPVDGYDWVSPVTGPASSLGTTQSDTTDALGQVLFQWNPGSTASPQDWESAALIDETLLAGYQFAGGDCTRKTLNGGVIETPFSLTELPSTIPFGTNDLVICNIYNINSATFTVNKDFIPNDAATVSVTFSCDDGTITSTNPQNVSEASPGSWTVTGISSSANCSASEGTAPAGYTKDESACQNVALSANGSASCTITNTLNSATFTVNKNFIPDSAASVSVTLSCDDGTIQAPNPTNASEASPAVWTITGISGSANCTAAESPVPAGHTASGCTTAVNLPANGSASCTITNTLNSATFTVNKNFIPDSAASVSVTLSCDDGTIAAPNPTNASEASPAVWTITGISGSANCTASESPVPAGYTASGCTTPVNLPENGSANCTITNTERTGTITVNKDFIPNNAASVSVTLVCSSGTIVAPNPTNATEASPAVFTVNGFNAGATCTATEGVPAGYTANELDCASKLLVDGGNVSCTITNTERTGTITVNKDFIPNNAASVSVTLVCSSGTIVAPNPTNATEAAPAVFTVNGFDAGATCTATEGVPAGYTANELDCVSKLLVDGGNVSCTITNTERTGTITVNKDFIPDNAASVSVTLVCSSGTIVAPNPTNASEASPAVFTVNGFDAGATCTATESVPATYTANELDCVSKLLVDGGNVSCTITNTIVDFFFTVNKDFIPDSGASVSVTLVCSSGTIGAPNPTNATEAAPAVFTISGPVGDPNCTATESPIPAGYVSTGQCSALLSVGTCTIVNTRTSATINVQKDFVPDDAASVTVAVVCTSGTVTNTDTSASEADDANFTVTGFNVAGTTCTATEGVPADYIADQSDCATKAISDGAIVTCTITNTLSTTASLNVIKDFTDDDASSVTIAVICTSGAITPVDNTASEADDANFTITNFTPGATCTATEGAAPNGYAKDESDCVGVAISNGGVASCTIVNDPISTEATLNVLKDFADGNVSAVTVSVTCTSGIVTANDNTASEADDANFTINGFIDPGTTCTATEGAPPAGYNKDESDCVAVAISDGGVASCTIVNTLGPPPVGGLVEIAVSGAGADAGGTSAALFGLLFVALFAVSTIVVATVRVTRRR